MEEALYSAYLSRQSGKSFGKGDKLDAFLVAVVRYKVLRQLRREHAGCRDSDRVCEIPIEELELVSREGDPASEVEYKELEAMLLVRMTRQQSEIHLARRAGESWVQIAAELGEDADALRIRQSRVLAKCLHKLGLDCRRP